MVLGPLTAQEAASLCGCDIPEPCPGPMAAIDEGDKIRTIYDGSWEVPMHTFRPIQKNAPQPLQSWTASTAFTGVAGVTKRTGTQEAPLCTLDWPKQDDQWMLLKADVTKAHRRVKILPPEWRYQVAKLEDEWWINKVGNIWYGQCATLLGASCLGFASPLISCLSHGGLGFCLCG